MDFMDFDEDEHIINDSDFISLEILQMEFNCLSPDNHQLWYLYKQYNDKYFSDDEKNMINNHIDKLINKQRKIDKNNIDKLKATDLGTMKIL
tara:strand:+ start:453 stop:728 length:276 start_codon:yes stop_codon:yes gene_type:complete